MAKTKNRNKIKNLKEFLQGTWRVERKINDRCREAQGRFVGTTVFTPEGEDLLYREEGRLTFGGHEGPALQTYRFGFPEPGRAAVHFSDGRFFHDLDFGDGAWQCAHLCDPDRYDGQFMLLSTDSWRVVWHVSGPRKDLILDSTYRRAL